MNSNQHNLQDKLDKSKEELKFWRANKQHLLKTQSYEYDEYKEIEKKLENIIKMYIRKQNEELKTILLKKKKNKIILF